MTINIPAPIAKKFAKAPKKPGVYIYRDANNEVIYVGKAVNLSNRSRSYFVNYKRLDPRIQLMVDNARDIEYLTVDSEVEALILETNLIKKYLPKYNVMGTDDKNYLWVKIDTNKDFPIVRFVREKHDDGADYFGPFPDKAPIKRMLKTVRRIFPYRTCSRVIEERPVVNAKAGSDASAVKVYSSDTKPCLYFHLGLCAAPCTTALSKDEYRQSINNLKRFFRSEHAALKKQLEQEMKELSGNQNYEKAAVVRDQLKDLEYLTKYTLVRDNFDDVILKQQKQQVAQQGVVELVSRLEAAGLVVNKSTASASYRIECYDISNIQGSNATSAMVVSIGGKPVSKLYRKFKIKTKTTPDDFAMLKETLNRRLKYLVPALVNKVKKRDESFEQMPDLLVIDGGKGQLSSVLKVMNEYEAYYGLSIPTIGLAKKQEEIFIPSYDGEGKLSFKVVHISKRSPALRILQQIRDEAHRFGLGYHRLLRSKGMTYSQLDLIPGVGEVTRKRLILAFGSVDGIRKAKLADIEAVIKNRNTAYKIKKLLV